MLAVKCHNHPSTTAVLLRSILPRLRSSENYPGPEDMGGTLGVLSVGQNAGYWSSVVSVGENYAGQSQSRVECMSQRVSVGSNLI